MKTWKAYAGVVGSKYLGEVRAETAEAAIAAAYDLDGPFLCHQCSDEVEDPEIVHVTVVCGTEEATDEPRTVEALRLLDLVDRYAARIRLNETDTASLDIFPPVAEEGWEISDSSCVVFSPSVRRATLPEAVEAVIEELGK